MTLLDTRLLDTRPHNTRLHDTRLLDTPWLDTPERGRRLPDPPRPHPSAGTAAARSVSAPAGPAVTGRRARPRRSAAAAFAPSRRRRTDRRWATAADGANAGASSRMVTVAVARPALRLTRRARLLLTVTTMLGLFAVLGLAAVNAGPATGGLGDAPATVVVQPGDTLWQIATEAAPAEDPVRVIRLLRSANDLDGGVLAPGTVLVIPRG